MIIYPAIDLIGGRCVRLRQGRFDEATFYSAHPFEALDRFEAAGAQWAHIVDLDGACAGSPQQHGVLRELARHSGLKLQVAGGIRSIGDLESLFDAGVSRAVIGSLAVEDPALSAMFLTSFGPERIALALDVRLENDQPYVTTSGWQQTSKSTLWEVSELYPNARHILITDIGRDGMMSGPNLDLITNAAQRLPNAQVLASGGVSSLEDLDALDRAGAAGAIIGKALWEGRIQLSEVIRHARA
jgi:phosphoribosylformimino-5-aminoimidazole carboxamide ribotide isomerase